MSQSTMLKQRQRRIHLCVSGYRIQLSHATVKALHSRLQHAYRRDDVRLVRRTTVLIDLLVDHAPVEVLRARWGPPPAFQHRPARGLHPRAPLRLDPPPSCGACPGRAALRSAVLRHVPAGLPRHAERAGSAVGSGPPAGGGGGLAAQKGF